MRCLDRGIVLNEVDHTQVVPLLSRRQNQLQMRDFANAIADSRANPICQSSQQLVSVEWLSALEARCSVYPAQKRLALGVIVVVHFHRNSGAARSSLEKLRPFCDSDTLPCRECYHRRSRET